MILLVNRTPGILVACKYNLIKDVWPKVKAEITVYDKEQVI